MQGNDQPVENCQPTPRATADLFERYRCVEEFTNKNFQTLNNWALAISGIGLGAITTTVTEQDLSLSPVDRIIVFLSLMCFTASLISGLASKVFAWHDLEQLQDIYKEEMAKTNNPEQAASNIVSRQKNELRFDGARHRCNWSCFASAATGIVCVFLAATCQVF